MKIAYNPKTAAALTEAPDNYDITFDLSGMAIYARGVKFDGKAPSVFKKHTSLNKGGYNGLVPVPSYTTTTTRFLREDGAWEIPSDTHYLYIGAKDVASNATTTNGNTYIKVTNNSTIRNQYLIKGAGRTTVESDTSGNVTITSPTVTWSEISGKPNTFTPSAHNHTTDQIDALTSYTKATTTAALATTDSLNTALGKLEYKLDIAYDWIIGVTTPDTDKYINKWQEILDFLNKINNTDGADITDEFVTRKTTQTITGAKTFSKAVTSTVADGTAPFIVTSSTLVNNLNVDLLDGHLGSWYLEYASYKMPDTAVNDWVRVCRFSNPYTSAIITINHVYNNYDNDPLILVVTLKHTPTTDVSGGTITKLNIKPNTVKTKARLVKISNSEFYLEVYTKEKSNTWYVTKSNSRGASSLITAYTLTDGSGTVMYEADFTKGMVVDYSDYSVYSDHALRLGDWGTSSWADANNALKEKPGVYFVHTSSGSNYGGHPSGSGIRVLRWGYTSGDACGEGLQTLDIYSPYNQNGVYIRQGKGDGTNMVYLEWKKIATTTDLNSYLPLAGGTLTGPLWIKSSTTSGDTPKLYFQRGTATDGYYDCYIYNTGGGLTFGYSSSSTDYDLVKVTSTTLRPNENNKYDLGSETYKWKAIYATSFIGTATSVSKSLKFGTKTYNGSAEATITAADLGALTAHQTIYNLTMQPGAFSNKVTFDPNSAAKTVNIPTHTSHLTNDSDFITSAALDDYLLLTGGTLTGPLTIKATPGITIKRASGVPYMRFANMASTPTTYGELGANTSGELVYWPAVSTASGQGAWNKVWHAGNDGADSGLDADLLDGNDSTWYVNCGSTRGSSNYEYGWRKVGTKTITSSGTHDSCTVFLISNYFGKTSGIIEVSYRKDSGATTANENRTYLRWITKTSDADTTKITATASISDNTTVLNLYMSGNGWTSFRAEVLTDGAWGGRTNTWTMYDSVEYTSGYLSIPSSEYVLPTLDSTYAKSWGGYSLSVASSEGTDENTIYFVI